MVFRLARRRWLNAAIWLELTVACGGSPTQPSGPVHSGTFVGVMLTATHEPDGTWVAHAADGGACPPDAVRWTLNGPL